LALPALFAAGDDMPPHGFPNLRLGEQLVSDAVALETPEQRERGLISRKALRARLRGEPFTVPMAASAGPVGGELLQERRFGDFEMNSLEKEKLKIFQWAI
jgi:hypothetical protein